MNFSANFIIFMLLNFLDPYLRIFIHLVMHLLKIFIMQE